MQIGKESSRTPIRRTSPSGTSSDVVPLMTEFPKLLRMEHCRGLGMYLAKSEALSCPSGCHHWDWEIEMSSTNRRGSWRVATCTLLPPPLYLSPTTALACETGFDAAEGEIHWPNYLPLLPSLCTSWKILLSLTADGRWRPGVIVRTTWFRSSFD